MRTERRRSDELFPRGRDLLFIQFDELAHIARSQQSGVVRERQPRLAVMRGAVNREMLARVQQSNALDPRHILKRLNRVSGPAAGVRKHSRSHINGRLSEITV